MKIKHVVNLIEDNEKNLWIGSVDSIYQITPDRSHVRMYGNENGVHKNEFDWNHSYKTKNGKLLIGDKGGYYAFFPEQVTSTGFPPQITFTGIGFNAGGEELKRGDDNGLDVPLYKA